MNLLNLISQRSIPFIALIAALNLIPINAGSTSKPAQRDVRVKQTWSGKNISPDLLAAAPASLYIADQTSWSKLWQAWRGSEPLPQVDFARELIVFCTTNTPNTCGIDLSLDSQSDLTITSVSTLIGSEAKTFNYQLGLIERAAIKSIGGKLIAPGNDDTNKPSANDLVTQLKQATQELLDAIAPGDKAVWQRHLAEGSIYADEEGRVLTKHELIKELNALPKGYGGSIKIAAKEELLPLCVDTFYRKGVWRGEKVFERDSQGRVIRMLDRRENNDLVWKKVR